MTLRHFLVFCLVIIRVGGKHILGALELFFISSNLRTKRVVDNPLSSGFIDRHAPCFSLLLLLLGLSRVQLHVSEPDALNLIHDWMVIIKLALLALDSHH